MSMPQPPSFSRFALELSHVLPCGCGGESNRFHPTPRMRKTRLA